MKFTRCVLILLAFGQCLFGELPDFVQTATKARVAGEGTWHITPRRIVWKSEEGLSDPENLLVPGLGQAVLGRPRPVCVMKSGGAVVLDFGVEIQGGIEIFTGIQENQKPVPVMVRFGESVSETMSTVGEQGATNDHAIRDEVVLLPWLGQRRIGATGFRFVRIEVAEADRELVIQEIRAVLEVRDLPYLGSFTSSDPRLDRIWEVGAWTVHLNMQDFLWDGIKRDRLVWVGDMHPEWRTIRTVFGLHEVVPKSLDLVAEITPQEQWMNGISSYSMWWIILLDEWYQHTHEETYLTTHWLYLKNLLTKLTRYVDETGKETLDGTRFLDWPSSENPEAIHAGLQSLMVMSMEAGQRLAKVVNDEELGAKLQATEAKLREHVPDPNGSKQAAALLAMAGLREAQEVNEEVIKVDGAKRISSFYGYYVLESLAKTGDIETAQKMIRDYWGAMLDLGATSFWEDFNLDWVEGSAGITELVPEGKKDIHGDFGAYCYEKFRHSLCHGWASGPTAFMNRHILGIEIVSPNSVRIQPNLGDLDWAEGTVPIASGVIQVRIEKGKEPEISVPAGVTVLPAE